MSAEHAQAWAELIEAFMLTEVAAGRTPITLSFRRSLLLHIASGIGCAPTEITEEAFAAWSGQHTTWKLETRRAYRNTAQSFARWAHKAGHLATPLELPTVPHPKVSARPTPDYAWHAALARADDRTRLMLRLAGELGLRRTEVAQVHRNDLMSGPQLIVHGKGNKDRLIPISAELAEAIGAADGWLFPSRQGGHLTPNMVGTLISNALPDHWTAHTLRHRFATRAYRGTRNLRAVQILLGHESVATTERYTAVDDDEVRAAMMSALDPHGAP